MSRSGQQSRKQRGLNCCLGQSIFYIRLLKQKDKFPYKYIPTEIKKYDHLRDKHLFQSHKILLTASYGQENCQNYKSETLYWKSTDEWLIP